MNADLVCEGGGVKGVALAGAITYLQEHGYEFKKIAGNSAGAIFASLVAVGYTGYELKEISFALDFKNFMDKTSLSKIPLAGPFLSIVKNKGIFKGDALEKFMEEKLKAKGKTQFKDISINGTSPLKIITADSTRKELVVLPDDLVKYNIDPLNFSIAKAVRMSISIPFIFKPILIEDNDKSSFMVDGGLISNFPVWLFDVEGIPRWPTFGLRLKSDDEDNFTAAKDTGLLKYLFNIIDTAISSNEEAYLNNKDSIRTIDIPTFDISTLDFYISKEKKEKLFNSGYNSATEFLDKWNFNIYVENYRNN